MVGRLVSAAAILVTPNRMICAAGHMNLWAPDVRFCPDFHHRGGIGLVAAQ
jgi:hypothetical protein